MAPRGPFEWLCAGAFKLRGVLMAPLVIYMLLHYDERWERSLLNWSAGLALFSLGMVLRVVAQRHLRYRLSGERRLARNGPYRLVRNPVYVANVFLLVGLALAAELPQIVPFVAVWAWFVYHLAVLYEERRLEQRYGDEYRAYRESVPRWLPRSIPLRLSSRTARAPWHQALAVEWQCSLLVLVPVVKEVVEHCWPAFVL
jgi:protein-S-isoprenylcysteine O-methyltransferase Ste14